MFADDLIASLFFRVLVDHSDGGAELDLIARQFRHVDDLGAADLVLDLGDLAFDPALPLLGGMVFGIFRQIAVRARFLDRVNDLRPLLAQRSELDN